jgi:transcriptional regulator of acetoin/glycerol metabolism
MSTDKHEITQTILPRGGPNRDGVRQGALIVLGDGASLDSLRTPRLVPMAELTLEIGRRAPATPGPATLTLADSTVSGLHARIQRAGDRSDLFVIHDLGSTNGTFVNGRRIHGPTPLEDGCVLFLGSQVLVFRLYTGAELAAVGEDAAAPLTPVATLSPALAVTISKLRRLARSESEILLLGETGVGKEVLARAIHASSPRAARALLSVNCAALSETLLESELFGHERGAFTGAAQAKPGLLETAPGGTVFLDEVGELPLAMQAKLLRVIEAREIVRVGGLRPRPIDVRFIAATNRDLEAEVQRNSFRRDLFFRLAGITLVVPPLRERPLDLPRLARDMLAELARQGGHRQPPPLPDATLDALADHSWPGNVRELRNVLERALLLCDGAAVTPAHLGLGAMTAPAPAEPVTRHRDGTERARVLEALAACGGNQSRAARRLGISRKVLIARLDTYGVARPRKPVSAKSK